MTYKNGIREYLLLAVCYGVPMGIIFGLWQKSVLVGIISGAMCGILYGVIMFLFVKSQEKKFDKMREQIASERKIICDGGATLHGNGGWLFLTEYGLEFYPHKVNFSRQEMRISLKSINAASVLGKSILISVKEYTNAITIIVTHNKEWQKQITDAVAKLKNEEDTK
jgi:hypothetical protein